MDVALRLRNVTGGHRAAHETRFRREICHGPLAIRLTGSLNAHRTPGPDQAVAHDEAAGNLDMPRAPAFSPQPGWWRVV